MVRTSYPYSHAHADPNPHPGAYSNAYLDTHYDAYPADHKDPNPLIAGFFVLNSATECFNKR